MSDAKTLDPRIGRLGPGFYVLGAVIAGVINAVTSRLLRGGLGLSQYRDVLLILAGFTAVSLLSICIQLVLGRMLVSGQRIPRASVAGLSVLSALVVLAGAYAGISGPAGFKRETGLLLAAATFFSIIPSMAMARMLVARRWARLGLVLIMGAAVRFFAWLPESWSNSTLRALGGLVAAQIVTAGLSVALGRDIDKPRQAAGESGPRLMVGALAGLVAVVGLSLIARRSALGNETNSYVVGMFIGRSTFFTSFIATYLFLPDLLRVRDWSLEVRRRFRRAWAFTFGVTIIGLVVGLVGIEGAMKNFVGEGWTSNATVITLVVVGWAAVAVAVLPFFYLVSLGSRFSWAIFASAVAMLLGQAVAPSETTLAVFFFAAAVIFALGVSIPVVMRQRNVVRPIIGSESSQPVLNPDGDLCVVIPSYNPGHSVIGTVRLVKAAFGDKRQVRVIAVSDGSTDESVELLDAMVEPWFMHINLGANRGKGAALLAGFEQSASKYTAFIDADGDIPPRLLVSMVDSMEAHDADVVFGSKWHPASRLEVSRARWVLSRVHHLIQVLLFDVNIDDTQAGIKVYRNDVLQRVRPILRETGFSLDLELFVAFAAVGHRRFVEAPIVIERSGSSTIRLRHVVQSFIDMLGIFWRARVGLEYHRAAIEAK